jgi:hypothetical protein
VTGQPEVPAHEQSAAAVPAWSSSYAAQAPTAPVEQPRTWS